MDAVEAEPHQVRASTSAFILTCAYFDREQPVMGTMMTFPGKSTAVRAIVLHLTKIMFFVT